MSAPAPGTGFNEREDDFMRLKVEGVMDAAELWVVALAEGREADVFGRRAPTPSFTVTNCSPRPTRSPGLSEHERHGGHG
jgi:hypothetical protein